MTSILRWICIFAFSVLSQRGLAANNCLVTSEPLFQKQLAYDALFFLDSLGISLNSADRTETTTDTFKRSDLFERPRTTLIGTKTVGRYFYEAELITLSLIKEFKRMFPEVERRAFVYRVEFVSRPNTYSEKCSDTGKRGRRFIEQINNITVID